MIEPGRSIAAPAGLTLYRVGTVKEIPGVRTYVAVDGGMSDNLRPVTYGARYEAFLPAASTAPRPFAVTVAGKHCEQGDLLVARRAAARRRRGRRHPRDAGHRRLRPLDGVELQQGPRPAVVFVRDGDARVVVRRETDDDLVRLDTDA